MKFTPLALALLLPFLASTSPIATPDDISAANPILAARGIYCTLGEKVHSHVGCYAGPKATGGKFIRWIEPQGPRFGVKCYKIGETVAGGKNRWDYIPGWGCYVSQKWTNKNCEGEFQVMEIVASGKGSSMIREIERRANV